MQFLEDASVRSIVKHLSARSELMLPQLLAEGRRFDLAFVDGNHRFDGVFVDLFYLLRLVRPGGVIILDDYQLRGGRRAAAFWVANLQ
ncbi:MAG: class I SAM-dependent methyltransferase [Chloroflexi bacterium]|nr:class I SAM-dependent methyltransferase [Chloroflexota bacterium]